MFLDYNLLLLLRNAARLEYMKYIYKNHCQIYIFSTKWHVLADNLLTSFRVSQTMPLK